MPIMIKSALADMWLLHNSAYQDYLCNISTDQNVINYEHHALQFIFYDIIIWQ